jgi:hypothetical protein
MKKLLVLSVLCIVTISSAMSLRQTACWLNGLNPTTTDTNTITPQQRVEALNITICSEISRNITVKTDFTNNTQFTDAQLASFTERGLNRSMTQPVLSQMVASSNVQANGISVTDSQLRTSFLNVMFGLIKMIGTGSF